VRDYHTQLQIYEKVTEAAVALEDPHDAPRLNDQTLQACLRTKRPVYIELPRDMVDQPCAAPTPQPRKPERSDPEALDEVVAESAALLRKAKRPVILAGVEIHRFGLGSQLVRLVERTGYPVAATLLGKSVISERHPQYLGVYEGAMGRDAVRRTVEASDCLLILGAFMTDINLGIHTARLDESRSINVTSERITISHHHYEGVNLRDFIDRLKRASLGRRRRNVVPAKPDPKPFKPRPGQPLTVKRLFQRIDQYIGDNTVVICDIGDSLFGAADLTIHRRTEFLSPAYYTSMGFAVPAAVGAQIKDRRLRPVVFVGDGAFQMTGHEISTLVRHKLNPILLVLNNKGYTTERIIHEGPYNDIHDWAYHLWPQLVREGWGCEVRTEGELETALVRAAENTACFSILNLHLDPLDHSASLERLGKRLGSKV
jgi:indolepyruvate decarboxylase